MQPKPRRKRVSFAPDAIVNEYEKDQPTQTIQANALHATDLGGSYIQDSPNSDLQNIHPNTNTMGPPRQQRYSMASSVASNDDDFLNQMYGKPSSSSPPRTQPMQSSHHMHYDERGSMEMDMDMDMDIDHDHDGSHSNSEEMDLTGTFDHVSNSNRRESHGSVASSNAPGGLLGLLNEDDDTTTIHTNGGFNTFAPPQMTSDGMQHQQEQEEYTEDDKERMEDLFNDDTMTSIGSVPVPPPLPNANVGIPGNHNQQEQDSRSFNSTTKHLQINGKDTKQSTVDFDTNLDTQMSRERNRINNAESMMMNGVSPDAINNGSFNEVSNSSFTAMNTHSSDHPNNNNNNSIDIDDNNIDQTMPALESPHKNEEQVPPIRNGEDPSKSRGNQAITGNQGGNTNSNTVHLEMDVDHGTNEEVIAGSPIQRKQSESIPVPPDAMNAINSISKSNGNANGDGIGNQITFSSPTTENISNPPRPQSSSSSHQQPHHLMFSPPTRTVNLNESNVAEPTGYINTNLTVNETGFLSPDHTLRIEMPRELFQSPTTNEKQRQFNRRRSSMHNNNNNHNNHNTNLMTLSTPNTVRMPNATPQMNIRLDSVGFDSSNLDSSMFSNSTDLGSVTKKFRVNNINVAVHQEDSSRSTSNTLSDEMNGNRMNTTEDLDTSLNTLMQNVETQLLHEQYQHIQQNQDADPEAMRKARLDDQAVMEQQQHHRYSMGSMVNERVQNEEEQGDDGNGGDTNMNEEEQKQEMDQIIGTQSTQSINTQSVSHQSEVTAPSESGNGNTRMTINQNNRNQNAMTTNHNRKEMDWRAMAAKYQWFPRSTLMPKHSLGFQKRPFGASQGHLTDPKEIILNQCLDKVETDHLHKMANSMREDIQSIRSNVERMESNLDRNGESNPFLAMIRNAAGNKMSEEEIRAKCAKLTKYVESKVEMEIKQKRIDALTEINAEMNSNYEKLVDDVQRLKAVRDDLNTKCQDQETRVHQLRQCETNPNVIKFQRKIFERDQQITIHRERHQRYQDMLNAQKETNQRLTEEITRCTQSLSELSRDIDENEKFNEDKDEIESTIWFCNWISGVEIHKITESRIELVVTKFFLLAMDYDKTTQSVSNVDWQMHPTPKMSDEFSPFLLGMTNAIGDRLNLKSSIQSIFDLKKMVWKMNELLDGVQELRDTLTLIKTNKKVEYKPIIRVIKDKETEDQQKGEMRVQLSIGRDTEYQHKKENLKMKSRLVIDVVFHFKLGYPRMSMDPKVSTVLVRQQFDEKVGRYRAIKDRVEVMFIERKLNEKILEKMNNLKSGPRRFLRTVNVVAEQMDVIMRNETECRHSIDAYN